MAEGAEIVTDSWRGYSECKNYYNHRIYNRQKEDGGATKQPIDNGINRVQSLWHMLKRNIHTYSTIRSSTL